MDLNSYVINNGSIVTDIQSVKIGDGTDNTLSDLLDNTTPSIQFLNTGKTIAHRGLYSSVPENTTASFEEACKRGFWGIETDIRNTSDGELICIHDATVDRTTDGTGTVANMTYKEIKACTIDAGNGISSYSGLKIPKFEEYLAICKQYGAVPVIEIKGLTNNDIKYYKKMLSIIKEYNMEENCICIGSQACMEIVRSLSYKIHVQVLIYQSTEVTDDLLIQVSNLKNSGIDFHLSHISANMIKKCHELGLTVGCWTINDTHMMESYKKLGIDFMTSNTYSLGCNLAQSQCKYDSKLKTSNKYIVDAINEINAHTDKNTAQLGGVSIVKITQADYDALETKDPDTLYFISE